MSVHWRSAQASPSAPCACLSSQLHRVCVCVQERQQRWVHPCFIIWFICVHSVLTSPCTMCPSNYCVTFQELLLCKLQSICCQAQSWVCPPPFLHLHRGSSLGLWCSSCLVHIFSASSLKSLPLRTQRSAWWNHPHTVYIAPHNTVSHGRASVSQPSVCALNGISLCMALPKLLHSE